VRFGYAWPVIAAIASFGCASNDGSGGTPVEVTYASEAAIATSTDAAFMYAATDPFLSPSYAFDIGSAAGTTSAAGSTTSDAGDAATTVAAGAPMYFTPKDCVETDMDATDVTFELHACNGPLGLQKASGTVHAHFSMVGDNVRVDLTSENLTVNGADATIDAKGVYSMPKAKQKQVAVTTQSTLKQDGDDEIARDESGTVTWNAGSKCATIKSMGQLTANDRDWDVDSDFVRCTGECPKSGSVMLIGSPSATVNFDGTTNPPYQTTDGNNGTVALHCGE
jgi:hypothetical protein